MSHKNVALVLSSGGSKGLAHIGVINELEKQGFIISSVSGSSIGSVIGGLYAMDKLPLYINWIKTLDRKKIWGLMDFTFSKDGFLKGERVFNEMQSFISDTAIEKMRIPFSAIATDIINEKDVVFNSGSFYKAIRASTAIPTAIKPIKHKDTYLVDGGVLCPMPIEYVKRKKDDLLVVVNLYGPKTKEEKSKEVKEEKVKGNFFSNNEFFSSLSNLINSGDKNSLDYFSLLNTTTSTMVHKITSLMIEKHQPDIVINIPSDSAKTFDFHKANTLIKLGERLAKEQIELFNKLDN